MIHIKWNDVRWFNEKMASNVLIKESWVASLRLQRILNVQPANNRLKRQLNAKYMRVIRSRMEMRLNVNVWECVFLCETEEKPPLKMCLLNKTICTHLLIFLVALEIGRKLAGAYHVSVEPQATLNYNGHIVSSNLFLFFFLFFSFCFGFSSLNHLVWRRFRSLSLTIIFCFVLSQSSHKTVNKLLPKVTPTQNALHGSFPLFPFYFVETAFFSLIHEILSMAFPFRSSNFFLLRSEFSFSLSFRSIQCGNYSSYPFHI